MARGTPSAELREHSAGVQGDELQVVPAADNALDPLGCLWTVLRGLGCVTIIYTLMFLAIFLAAFVSRIIMWQ